MSRVRLFLAVAAVAVIHSSSFAQTSDPCPRFPTGSMVAAPPDLYSQNGVLTVNFTYQTEVDSNGLTRYCFVTGSGAQSPTLHVNPGDELIINLTNGLPQTPANMAPMPEMTVSGASCTPGAMMTSASVNIHYHGTNTPPLCHQDEVITTLVNAASTFRYQVLFPADEPPGLYWYHPHVHGIAEAAVLGGASGAIIVEGIQNVNPSVAGLPQRNLIIRDNLIPGLPQPGQPAWDISLNYIPIPYPSYPPALIQIKPGEKQFWRVLNASADTIVNLQVVYDGVAQTVSVIALDGVPVNSQDGTTKGTSISENQILIPPAGRAEFIVTGPSLSVQSAQLRTLAVDTGPAGDNDPTRPLATIQASASALEPPLVPAVSGPPPPARFANLANTTPTTQRSLYFSEVFEEVHVPVSSQAAHQHAHPAVAGKNPKWGEGPIQFFITVKGQTPVVFNAANPPAIVTTQGAVEDWTIENQTEENHEFHIHQIHFLLLAVNGKAVTGGQYMDTVQIPYWTGAGPYPSVTVRMDFRGETSGDFVYHCHILEHEDGGMMAIIRVLPAAASSKAAARGRATRFQ